MGVGRALFLSRCSLPSVAGLPRQQLSDTAAGDAQSRSPAPSLPLTGFCAAAGPGGALSFLQKGTTSAMDHSCIGLLVPLALKPLEATLISL